LVLIARTTATASELFYTFDALRRFLDAQVHAPEAREPERYVTYQALGKAILLALPPAMRGRFCPRDLRDAPPRRSVVLIDEIDKAPRDFPNDILNEIERLEFTVAEADERFPNFEAEQKRLVKEEGYSAESAAELVQSYVVEFQRNRPVLILTSNDEKKLPDAFLRRCVFHHITFPDAPTLERILVSRLARKDHSVDEGLIAAAVDLFSEMRDRLEDKKPATAELIAWVRILAREGVSGADLAGHYASDDTLEVLRRSIPVLAKTAPDREAALGFLDDLRIPPAQE
ncbi:MAG TPA: MoxR family ATPase, partial [Armatimonadota bacterium]|nr:MoxR family ATPase [Armatimonadota bacterium]